MELCSTDEAAGDARPRSSVDRIREKGGTGSAGGNFSSAAHSSGAEKRSCCCELIVSVSSFCLWMRALVCCTSVAGCTGSPLHTALRCGWHPKPFDWGEGVWKEEKKKALFSSTPPGAPAPKLAVEGVVDLGGIGLRNDRIRRLPWSRAHSRPGGDVLSIHSGVGCARTAVTRSGSRRSSARRLNLCFLALAVIACLRVAATRCPADPHVDAHRARTTPSPRLQPRACTCARALAALHGVNAQRVWHAALAESANAASLFRNAEEIKLFAISSPLLTPSCTFPAGTLP
ncbi:hypothetical protein L1887_58835 [Cichorium endivia]|nr:hypothetical protein L1887_58835 [Cichorium endivia]